LSLVPVCSGCAAAVVNRFIQFKRATSIEVAFVFSNSSGRPDPGRNRCIAEAPDSGDRPQAFVRVSLPQSATVSDHPHCDLWQAAFERECRDQAGTTAAKNVDHEQSEFLAKSRREATRCRRAGIEPVIAPDGVLAELGYSSPPIIQVAANWFPPLQRGRARGVFCTNAHSPELRAATSGGAFVKSELV
jgi:hypothetical protein